MQTRYQQIIRYVGAWVIFRLGSGQLNGVRIKKEWTTHQVCSFLAHQVSDHYK